MSHGGGTPRRKFPDMLLYAADRKKDQQSRPVTMHSRDVGRAVVRVYPDNEFGWRAQVITAPTSVEPLQIAAERTASDLRALYDLKNKHRLGKVA